MNPYILSIPIALFCAMSAGLLISGLIAVVMRKNNPPFFALLAYGSVIGIIVFFCAFPIVTMFVALYTAPSPFGY